MAALQGTEVETLIIAREIYAPSAERNDTTHNCSSVILFDE